MTLINHPFFMVSVKGMPRSFPHSLLSTSKKIGMLKRSLARKQTFDLTFALPPLFHFSWPRKVDG